MKKILLSFLSLTFIGLANLATADTVLAWNQVYNGYYVKVGCIWQAAGATPYGPVQNLMCNNVLAAEIVPNGYGVPGVVNAIGNNIYVTAKGGDGNPNGYNYVIYQRTGPGPYCAKTGQVIALYPAYNTAVNNVSADSAKCGSGCTVDVFYQFNGGGKSICR